MIQLIAEEIFLFEFSIATIRAQEFLRMEVMQNILHWKYQIDHAY